MSDLLNRWPKLAMTMAVLGIAASVAFLIQRGLNANKRPKGDLWFYNLKTHQLFPASDLSVAPIDTKSGPGTGVRAHVFTCDRGSNPTNFIAFLEKLTPEVKREVEAELKRGSGQMGIGFALERRQGDSGQCSGGGTMVSKIEPRGFADHGSWKNERRVPSSQAKCTMTNSLNLPLGLPGLKDTRDGAGLIWNAAILHPETPKGSPEPRSVQKANSYRLRSASS
ncbi:MAG: hypothetical protein EXS27_01035 [Pedosphaera sp.]|nr:hypothetical protein [Pedosphaera sp.]